MSMLKKIVLKQIFNLHPFVGLFRWGHVTSPSSNFRVGLTSGGVFRATCLLIGIIVTLSVLSCYLYANFEFRGKAWLMQWFGLDNEGNLPSFFSSVQLLLAAAVCFLASRRAKNPESRGWKWLGTGMAYMAVDEFIQIHERLNALKVDAGAHPFFAFSWVIPGMAIVVLCALVFAPFLFKLPRVTSFMLVASGALFVGGAVGMEMVGAWQRSLHTEDSWQYITCYTIEETLEMVGIALFIRTVIRHIGEIDVTFRA